MINVTINQLITNYTNYLQAQNADINASAPNSYWQIQAGAMAAILLDLYANLQLTQNSIYPQNSVGDQVDLWLYDRGLPARGALTYGTIEVLLTTGSPATIPIKTIFTDSITGNQYQNLQELAIGDNITPFVLYALVAGNNYIEAVNANLSANSLIVTVQSCTNGQLEESDQSCINRILTSIRAPIAGARATDYAVYTLQANSVLATPVVTDSIQIIDFEIVSGVGKLGNFVIVGTNITEYQLNQGLLPSTSFIAYSRAADSSVVNQVNAYIQALRLVGLPIIVGTSITQLVVTGSSLMNVTVSLIQGYNLTTIINVESQDISGNPIIIQLTVGQLIQKSIRQAICNQPYGATVIGGANFITLDSIYQVVNAQLSANDGSLFRLLTNINISGGDISVHSYTYNADNLYYTYDIDAYSSIILASV